MIPAEDLMSKSNRDCGPCYLQSFPTSNGLERVLSRVIVFEEEIARQRVEEDLRLYGSRPESADAVDIDKPNQLANLLPCRSSPEFAAVVDHPAKVRMKGEPELEPSDSHCRGLGSRCVFACRMALSKCRTMGCSRHWSVIADLRSTEQLSLPMFGGLTLATCTPETNLLAR